MIELMITLVVLAAVMVGLGTVLLGAARNKASTTNASESAQGARVATDLIGRDLRSAGYGADVDYAIAPQTPIAYVDSLQVLINENLKPYPDNGATRGWPLAYNPNASPRPFPLNGTAWAPPIRYRSGAEVVRWTLDLNNDGVVNSADLADPNGIDARRTRNPNDYELVRQVYGDSTNATANNNGPQSERVALVSLPGGSVPPLFTVYLKGASQPWDWSDGPVPPGELVNIARVLVRVTSPSAKPDFLGKYASTTYTAEVRSLRNTPDLGEPEYGVDGYVFSDANYDGVKNPGESGIADARVNLGVYSTITAANGYFVIPAPAGTYTLRHTPPANYGVFSYPDSYVVTVPPAVSRSFADTARAGGWVTSRVFNDLDADGYRDAGEPDQAGVMITMSFLNQVKYTDANGRALQFAGLGSYTVTCTAPDSFFVTTPNPVSGYMMLGGADSLLFGVSQLPSGTISGTVYRDNNKNGTLDAGETGIANVWVGVSKDGGTTFLGFAYTDVNGGYAIRVPANDPPHTTPYDVTDIPPPGFFPTSPNDIGNLWVQADQTLTNKNFGMASFQVIRLNASRVLSLASGDVQEKDYSGTSANAHRDADIQLGADAAGVDQISTWFNQWNASPLFNATPTYTRSAPQAVLALAIDTLDSQNPRSQPDLITGTKGVVAGNFFVWLTQSSGSNEGYLPTSYSLAYRTADNGDVQALVTTDCAGGSGLDMPDIIVGTKSPTLDAGSIEVWKNNNGVNPDFTREDIYPPSGILAAGGIGEVTCMAMADMDNDGRKDLVVGTRTGSYSGQVLFFKFLSKTSSPHFSCINKADLQQDAVNSIAVLDMDDDGNKDVVVGTQSGIASGNLIYFRNQNPLTLNFEAHRTVEGPGIITTVGAGDFGGTTAQDLVVGYRQSSTSFAGGVQIYYLDDRTLPISGTDPSGGEIVNWVPAITVNDFNFGANPTPSPPYLLDFAVGVKSSDATGALVVFIR